MPVSQAYDLWAAGYDAQPDNVVFAVENDIFSNLLQSIDLVNKSVLDIGCGTGRHWNALLARLPAKLIGVDVSRLMLDQLQNKFPGAEVHLADDHKLPFIESYSIDVIISTLALAHIANFDAAMEEWFRVLRPGGTLLITDFHSEGIRRGMKRTFQHEGKSIEVAHHSMSISSLREALVARHCTIAAFEERVIDERVRPAYEHAHAEHLYDQYLGTPLVYGLVARHNG